jgi:hypothetical protein
VSPEIRRPIVTTATTLKVNRRLRNRRDVDRLAN